MRFERVVYLRGALGEGPETIQVVLVFFLLVIAIDVFRGLEFRKVGLDEPGFVEESRLLLETRFELGEK